MRRTNRTSRPEREALRDILLSAAVVGVLATPALAGDVEEFYFKTDWEAAVDPLGGFTTLGFADLEPWTVVTNQYIDEGILFTDGNDVVVPSSTAYPNDGRGLEGNLNDDIEIEFAAPQQWLSLEFPGVVRIRLYLEDELIYHSPSVGGSGPSQYFGLVRCNSI